MILTSILAFMKLQFLVVTMKGSISTRLHAKNLPTTRDESLGHTQQIPIAVWCDLLTRRLHQSHTSSLRQDYLSFTVRDRLGRNHGCRQVRLPPTSDIELFICNIDQN